MLIVAKNDLLQKNIEERLEKNRYVYRKPKKKKNFQLWMSMLIAIIVIMGMVFSLMQVL